MFGGLLIGNLGVLGKISTLSSQGIGGIRGRLNALGIARGFIAWTRSLVDALGGSKGVHGCGTAIARVGGPRVQLGDYGVVINGFKSNITCGEWRNKLTRIEGTRGPRVYGGLGLWNGLSYVPKRAYLYGFQYLAYYNYGVTIAPTTTSTLNGGGTIAIVSWVTSCLT